MIKSMTGFGRVEETTEQYKISVEIKSVNHRYLDLSIKLPKRFNPAEAALRRILKQYSERGKIDVYINYEDYSGKNMHVHYNDTLAEEYLGAIKKAAEVHALRNDLSAYSLLRLPEVLTLEETESDIQEIVPVLETVLRKAAERFRASRETEGEALYQDIMRKLSYILELVSEVEKRSPEILQEYRQKILNKVEEFLGDRGIDESILATELVVYADKVCVDEETVRLRSHVENMQHTLELEEAIGRKLDFIAQEMNREANTILSKANDRKLSEIAINLKTEIEKIREQIQNIE